MALTRRKSADGGSPPDPAQQPVPAQHPVTDEQVREMVADPQRYFTEARAAARREAKVYVARRLAESRVKTA